MRLKLRLGNAVRHAADKAAQSRSTDGLLAPGEEIEINNTSFDNMGALTLRGFAAPEADGIWSSGDVSLIEVRMRAVNADRRYRLIVSAIPFQGPGHRALVEISINGGPAHQVLSKGSGWLQIEADCQLGMVGRTPGFSISLQVANPMSPNALNMGEDYRLLGFKIRSLKFVDIGAASIPSQVVVDQEQGAPAVAATMTPPPASSADQAPAHPEDVSLSPGEVIHALANRGPLWRKILLDKNPLVRVARWMRRVTRSLQTVEHQLDLIRLDSARQMRELSARVSENEVKARAPVVGQDPSRMGIEAIMTQLQANNERLLLIEQASQVSHDLHAQNRRAHADDLGAIVGHTSELARNYDQFVETLRSKQQAQQALIDAFEAVEARMRTFDERIGQLRADHEHRFALDVDEIGARHAGFLELMTEVDRRWSDAHAALQRGLDDVVKVAEVRHQPMVDDSRLVEIESALRSLGEGQQSVAEGVQSQIAALSAGMERWRNDLALISNEVADKSSPHAVDKIDTVPAEATQDIIRLLVAAHEKLDASGAAALNAVEILTSAHEKLDAQGARLESLPGTLAGLADAHSPIGRRVLRSQHGWLIATGFGYFSCDEHDDLLAMCLAEYGDVERGLRLFLDEALNEGDTFVDVGANIGLHTVVGAKRVGEAGRVLAIEAMPRTIDHLRASLRLSGVEDRVEVWPVAAGASDEDDHIFHVAAVAGHSSLYPLHEEVVEQVKVNIRSLDNLLPSVQVKLVKIDVEGAELDVIQGMHRVIAENPNVGIVAEYASSHLERVGTDSADWERMREQHGFALYLVDDMTGRRRLLKGFDELRERVSSNVLLCRPDSPLVAAPTAGEHE